MFGQQLRAKQLAKRYYGVRERQFRRYVKDAQRSTDQTGSALLITLERRLDNVVYRLGLASTRAQARQFVGHGHILVDGTRVDGASYLVDPGQLIELRQGSPVEPLAREATELTGSASPWLETDLDGLRGKVLRAGNSANSVWLNLEGGLALRIARSDLHYFPAFNPHELVGKTVVARGWLRTRGGASMMMQVRHPAALRVEADEGTLH